MDAEGVLWPLSSRGVPTHELHSISVLAEQEVGQVILVAAGTKVQALWVQPMAEARASMQAGLGCDKPVVHLAPSSGKRYHVGPTD